MRYGKILILLSAVLLASSILAQVPVVVPPPAPSAPPAPAVPALPAVPAPSPVKPPAPPAAPPVEGAPAAPPPLTPINQVQIQVWISETNEIGLRDLGANLQYTRVVRNKAEAGAVEQVRTQTFNPLNPAFNVTLPVPDTSMFPKPSTTPPPVLPLPNAPRPLRPDADNSAATNIQTQSGGGLVFNIVKSNYGTLEGILRGIEQKSDGDLISKPELLVIDNGIAEIHMGEQTPYQNVSYTALGTGNLVVTWQEVGVNLKLQPLILSSDSVQINMSQLAVSERVISQDVRGVDLPIFATRSQTGVVLVPNGQTLVIGGLASRRVQSTERRVPILGSIPLLGIPFRGRNSQATNSHLLIFVSPTIINLRDLSEEAKSAMNFWQDRRWENSERISKEIQVMQDEL